MPRLVNLTPKYRHHRHSGQAIVTIDGKDHYLGPFGTKASKVEYDRLIAEWLAAGRRQPLVTAATYTTVVELGAAYWRFAQGYYQKNGRPTRSIERIRTALKLLRAMYGERLVADFGPLALRAMQSKFIEQGQSRTYINHLIEQIKRIFKWGVSHELAAASVYQALATVPGLKKGRSEAAEPVPVRPVLATTVEATLPHLPPIVADMVRFELLTGCRPGEVCMLRPCDVDRSSEIWAYRPSSHKTEHHGRERVICVGPRAQEILKPYLLRDAEAYCFTPIDSERKRLETRHRARKTPLSCGNRPGTNRKRRRKMSLGEQYDTNAYAKCVRRAADLADRDAHAADPTVAAETRIVPQWSPNQLRHSRATEVRRRFGLEAVQVVLGHAKADVSQIYAERDLSLAERIMAEVG